MNNLNYETIMSTYFIIAGKLATMQHVRISLVTKNLYRFTFLCRIVPNRKYREKFSLSY